MQKEDYVVTLMFRATQSGKTYRNEGNKGPKDSPLISPPQGDKEDIIKVSLQSSIHLIRQRIPQVPPPPTPPLASPPSPPSSHVPPPPPP